LIMPYINQDDRNQYDHALLELSACLNGKPKGHLTYVVYVLARRFVRDLVPHYSTLSYSTLSGAKSALQDATDEFHRKVLVPYEDEQLKKNRDAT
jgi:hypothetical protein